MIIIFLKQVEKIRKQIEEKEEYLAQMEARATKSTSSIKKINIGPTNINYDKTGDLVADIADLKTEIERAKKNLCRIEKQIRLIIARLPLKRMQDIMIYRYIGCLRWQEVISKSGYGRRHVFNLHSQALKHLTVHPKPMI